MDQDPIKKLDTAVAGMAELYNSSPAKIQPWKHGAIGIPMRAQACSGGNDADSTHGIPKGSWLIMQNAPAGLRPQDNF